MRCRWAHPAGQSYRDDWNRGVSGPNLFLPESLADLPYVSRRGNRITLFSLNLYGDAGGHFGSSTTDTGTSRLFRSGALVGEVEDPQFARFVVPPEPADFRVEVESVGGGVSLVSTHVKIAWTFRSAETPVDKASHLPALSVQFTPPLDDRNRAPAGRFFVIPLSVARQPDAPFAPIDRLAVAVSYDRGETWKHAISVHFGDVGLALVRHPRAGGTVSLRARAEDRDGNTVEQTILDAYLLD